MQRIARSSPPALMIVGIVALVGAIAAIIVASPLRLPEREALGQAINIGAACDLSASQSDGMQLVYTLADSRISVLTRISESGAVISVDGQATRPLMPGQKAVLPDGTSVTVTRVRPQPNGRVTFCIMRGQAPALRNDALFVSQEVPSSMVAGGTYSATIVMRNAGTTKWRRFTGAREGGGMHRLGSQSPENNALFVRATRVELPRDVLPGEEVALTFTLTAPLEPGTYTFQWRMVEELKEWFGAATPPVAVTVEQAPSQELWTDMRIQDVVPWTAREYLSPHANTYSWASRFCYDPATGEVYDWNGMRGCGEPRKKDIIGNWRWFIGQHPDKEHILALNIFFPDGTFTDRMSDGTQVRYASSLQAAGHTTPIHAMNIHDPRTQRIYLEAQAAVMREFSGIGIDRYQIGYNIYQENLLGTFGYSLESLARFKEWWGAQGKGASRLGADDLGRVDRLVQGLDPQAKETWPLPVQAGTPEQERAPETMAKRQYYAYFQKFREQDTLAFHQRLLVGVREAEPQAWVFMYDNARIYLDHSVVTPLRGERVVHFGELNALPLLDPQPVFLSMGKDEGMDWHAYRQDWCVDACMSVQGVPRSDIGLCRAASGRTCVCERTENGCMDDWSVDRTIAYLRRGMAFGARHRSNDQYVRSGWAATAGGANWTYDDSERRADFFLLDSIIFNGYARPGEQSLLSRYQDRPAEVAIYYPGWTKGAVTRQFLPNPYATARPDEGWITNLLESHGVAFRPVGDNWCGVSTKIIVPYYDYLSQLLADIPCYDAAKVVPLNALPAAAPNPVTHAYNEQAFASLRAQAGISYAPLAHNPLVKSMPENPWEAAWAMKAGARGNLVYNLDGSARCVGLWDGRTILLAPFETYLIEGARDDRCARS